MRDLDNQRHFQVAPLPFTLFFLAPWLLGWVWIIWWIGSFIFG